MEHVSGAPSAVVGLGRPARLLRLASDERLLALVREGDERAFEVLYDRHHGAILGFCRHMLGSREEAEDALQQTFLSAYRDLVGSGKAIDLRPWLFAIARNRCLSTLRARREHADLALAEPSTDGLAATVERREELRELLGDLAKLPEDQRAALLLAELGSLDHAGIAAVLGCPREKVKALVFQARSSLIADREARATPCEQIRMELATASGGALRRGPLRRHLQACAGCRGFKAEIAEQRRLLALALPVLPAAAVLKAGVLASVGGGSGASGGAVSSAAGGLAGGGLGAIASGGAAKVAVSLTLAGAIVGGGTLAGRDAAAPHHTGGGEAAARTERAPGAAATPRAGAPAVARGDDAQTRRARRPANGRQPAPGAPRGAMHPPVAIQAPPAAGVVPDHGAVPRAPGSAPGHSGVAPGHSGSAPGRSGTAPGKSGAAPGHDDAGPGRSEQAPGRNGTAPGQGGTAPGRSGSAPGRSGTAPGHDDSAPAPGAPPPSGADESGTTDPLPSGPPRGTPSTPPRGPPGA